MSGVLEKARVAAQTAYTKGGVADPWEAVVEAVMLVLRDSAGDAVFVKTRSGPVDRTATIRAVVNNVLGGL